MAPDRPLARVALALTLLAPLWAPQGASVPLALTVVLADGGTVPPAPLRMERAARIEPGARVHVAAQLDPQTAARAAKLLIAHRPLDTQPDTLQESKTP